MTLKQDIQAYQARWSAVQAVQIEEQLNASMELRWQQLNTVYGIAKGLGLLQWDSSEMEVFERWAKLKSQATNQGPKAS